MVQRNLSENLETLALTGQNDNLLAEIKQNIESSDSIDIIVSFLMESGVSLILDELSEAVERGVKLRILTGNYLNITEPSALYLLKQRLGNKVDLRFFNNPNLSFHPKSYIFHKQGFDEIYIGSSNLSKTALTLGIEWNYKFSSYSDEKASKDFNENFNDLFENHSIPITDEVLRDYSKAYKKPEFLPDLTPDSEIKPRGVQVEAIYSLEKLRGEGVQKALVQAATGVGKTYLAGFDSLKFDKVLFVAHREEILQQAYDSFKNIRPDDDFGFFNSKNKDTDKNIVFASIQSLSRGDNLETFFTPDQFDYIVIDEFHHAQANSYRKVIDYFKPKFMLGLTATPERTDGRSIFELLDYNVAYEIGLPEAIEKGLLVPFHYYGIHDETIDYSQMKFVRGDYNTEDLNVAYIGNLKRDKLIFENFKKHNPTKAIGFCSSVEHANYMAEVFTKHGVPAYSVTSKNNSKYSEERKQALRDLENGNVQVIFSVDMFNEGLDVPDIDLVMFLRPTESSIIFLQQLGRGLRKSEGKEYLTVLDFIGNYRNAGKFARLLTGEKAGEKQGVYNLVTNNKLYPSGCFIDFDLGLIDVLEQMERKTTKKRDLIVSEFYRIKDYLKHVPSRTELFNGMDADIIEIVNSSTKLNPFKNYLGFLGELGELTEGEIELTKGIGADFLNLVETTSFTRSYKIPVLKSFIEPDRINNSVDMPRIVLEWKQFFSRNRNYRDLSGVENLEELRNKDDKFHQNMIKKNPVKYLIDSGKGFFKHGENSVIELNNNLSNYLGNPDFIRHYKDILEFREKDYYYRRYRDEKSR